LTNNDALEHDFSIVEFPVDGTVQTDGHAGHEMDEGTEQPDLHVGAAANGSGAIEFTPSQPGTFEFFCMVPGHKEAGMIGSLVVTAPSRSVRLNTTKQYGGKHNDSYRSGVWHGSRPGHGAVEI
jgi:hypothetical protein